MDALLLMVLTFGGYILMYRLYGRYIGRKVFALSANAKTPSVEMEDGVDYVPTKKEIIFGHHFTSVSGTGPIVGPAIAVIWGWLPALLWVFAWGILPLLGTQSGMERGTWLAALFAVHLIVKKRWTTWWAVLFGLAFASAGFFLGLAVDLGIQRDVLTTLPTTLLAAAACGVVIALLHGLTWKCLGRGTTNTDSHV